MELVTPAIGLIFWTTVVFTLLVLLLKKFAWKPILSAVDQRNQSIKESLAEAEKARAEMSELTANNEKILAQAKLDRDIILKEARDIEVNLKLGNDAFECYTCDFTHDYIDINADYRN